MFKLNLYTPDGIVVKDYECDELLVPTSEGEINVLENHTHVLSTLTTGVLSVRQGDTWKYCSITHGTCKILGNTISILSMTSEKAEDIDKERAESALKKAQSRLSGEGDTSLNNDELTKQQRKEQRAKVRMQLAYLRGE